MHYTQKLKNQTNNIPEKSGIYIYRDQSGKIIYVGKAINLRKRVRSYFSRKAVPGKTAALVGDIDTIDYYVTENEVEALILENNFIKENRPAYNVAYRDDKSYPYLAVSVSDKFPRIRYTRERRRKDSRYFGPYTNANAMRETLDLIISVFPIRSCRDTLFTRAKSTGNPCLYYHIKRCVGPCVGKITVGEYKRLVDQIIAFLEGRQEQVISDLAKLMKDASDNLEFEKAAHYRDRIEAAKKILTRQKVFSDNRLDQDIFGLAVDNGIGSVQLLKVRNGKLIGTEDLILEKGIDLPKSELLGSVVKQFYLGGSHIPAEILLPLVLEDEEAIEKWLSQSRGNPVKIKMPKRGLKNQLINMAKENAYHSLERHKTRTDYENKRVTAALAGLKEKLELEKMDVIECYDISTIKGEMSVGSMVAFKGGKPEKQAYRRFKVRQKKINDFAMMKEVLTRRFSHFLADDDGKFVLKPDLVIVDGGIPQLSAAMAVFNELEITDVALAALAKREEELFQPGRKKPVSFPKNSSELHLLQRIRDEAHRFAHGYHTHLRRKSLRTSILDEVRGIGPKKKSELIGKFGSLKKIALASVDELQHVLGEKTGRELFRMLRNKNV